MTDKNDGFTFILDFTNFMHATMLKNSVTNGQCLIYKQDIR